MVSKTQLTSFALLVAVLAPAVASGQGLGNTTAGASVSQSTYTGLYNSSGTQVVSSVNVVSASFTLNYQGSLTQVGSTETCDYDPDTNGYMQTKVRIKYSSTGWTSAPNSAVVGIQVANYFAVETLSTMAVSLSLYTYFALPATTILSYVGGKNPYSADVSYSDVNPVLFQVNAGTVDSSDSSGKTAIYTYNCTSTTPSPWVYWPQKDFSFNYSLYSEDYFPTIWLFAKPGSNGAAFATGVSYPLPGP